MNVSWAAITSGLVALFAAGVAFGLALDGNVPVLAVTLAIVSSTLAILSLRELR